MRFRTDTTVVRDGTGWTGTIHDAWDILGNANGGYVAAIAARAFCEAVGRPDPISVTTHYLAPGRPGPVELDVRVVKEGRRFATGSVTMRAADGRPVVEVLMNAGDLAEAGDEPDHIVDATPPPLPPFEEIAPRGEHPVDGSPALFGRLDVRIHPDDAGFGAGRPSGHARMRAWFGFADDEPIDAIGLVFAADAMPPTIFNAALPLGWVPTVEMTTHVRRHPAPGALRTESTTRFVTGGFLEEDGLLWDRDGALVAQSRQLALVPRPAP